MSRLSEVTQEQRDRLRENTIRMTASGLPFISYKGEDGQFKLGDRDVTDCNFMAVIDRCDAVWFCFLNGTVKELTRTNMMDEAIPPKPKGYDDSEQWEKWERGKDAGKPKDPLMLQYELPLITNDDDMRAIVFKASTKLPKEAVQRLLDAVNTNDDLRRPFVTLTVAPNPDNVHQMLPDFTITGYSDDLEDIVLPGDKKFKPTNGSGPAPSRNSDMDDNIPF